MSRCDQCGQFVPASQPITRFEAYGVDAGVWAWRRFERLRCDPCRAPYREPRRWLRPLPDKEVVAS